MSTKDGGPAFPTIAESVHLPHSGMSLRDWFAGMALQGWISGPLQGDVMDDYDGDEKAFDQHQGIVAKLCYGYADAMLAARKGGTDE